MNRSDLSQLKAVTLLIKAETIDSIVRRNHGVPIPEEREAYAAIVEELTRRGPSRYLPYYQERLRTVYEPRERCAREGGQYG